MITAIFKKIFGSKAERDLKRMQPQVDRINELEEEYQKLPEDKLKAKTEEFRQRLKDGETLEDIMCEAFAVVKNACRRNMGQPITVCEQPMEWDMIPYDVQLLGAMALHRGGIAEMATGEGKTLVATMPLYLNSLTGRNSQLVTVNDFLARRDAEWMGTIYKYLGLTVGCLQSEMRSAERHEMYGCNITYGTNSEFGFDYLRDMGMAMEADQMVQRDHHFAIIDEIDSILIDEARTPLIISGPVAVSTHQFDKMRPLVDGLVTKQNALSARLVREARETLSKEDISDDAKRDALIKLLQVRFSMPTHKQLMRVLEDSKILKPLEKLEMEVRSDNNRGMLQDVQADMYFVMDERQNEADLTEKGRNTISPDDPEMFVMPDMLEELHKIDNDKSLDEAGRIAAKTEFQKDFSEKSERLHNISQLLKAYCLFEKDVHYVVQDNKVMIVDEHTGRLRAGHRFSDGLHQALEAKENVEIERETQTMATITIQNYFRLYEKLSGMTGTAETEANEFHQIYKLDVIVIPTNKPCIRDDNQDLIFKTRREKFNALVDEVEERHNSGQPILLGTISVEDSEILSRLLKRKNIPHNVLNAKNHQGEAETIAQAGQKGGVTVATNMAGRGTDIKLGEGVVEAGGLCVIASSRHDSRRIDRQLRGRCSRQGDPGVSMFYVALEDNLMRLFGSDRIVKIMERFGMEEGEELQHPWLTKSIETAQRRVEQHHFSIRKRTLEFDDVMNKQREIIYGQRKDILLIDEPKDILFGIVEEIVDNMIAESAVLGEDSDKPFDTEKLISTLSMTFPVKFSAKDVILDSATGLPEPEGLLKKLVDRIEEAYDSREQSSAPEQRTWLERRIALEPLDRLWQEHLYEMDHLRSSIYLRTYAQKDPLVEYKNEAYKVFEGLLDRIHMETVKSMFSASVESLEEFENFFENMPQELVHEQFEQFGDVGYDGMGGQAGEMPENVVYYKDLPPEIQAQVMEQARADGIPDEVVKQMPIALTPPDEEEARYVDEEPGEDYVPFTYRRDDPKVGPNDPCPCGSGKKYKKCCG
jgi:preprotein translocase subunit SecA